MAQLSDYRWVGAAAVAAAVVVGVVMFRRETRRIAPADQAVRGAAVRALAPTGVVHRPVAFQWASVPGAGSYVLLVRNARGDSVWSTEVQTTRVDAPPDVESRFAPGEEYFWQVVALDSRRERIAQSARQAFLVASRAP